jgi:prepilin-type processing-associated H-X9-DG protein
MVDVANFNAHAWGTMILPYLEQGNLYSQYNFSHSFAAPAAPFGGMYPNSQNQAVITTPLAVFTCPSSAETDRIYTFTLPAGAVGPSPQVTYKAAMSDYGVVTGYLGALWNLVKQSPTYGNADPPGGRAGILRDSITYNGMELGGHPKGIRDATDGTTNTLLICEIAGRNSTYMAGKKVMDWSNPMNMNSGGGWGDPVNGENWFAGSLYDGTGTGGPCVINCTNLSGRGAYSFHTGGTHVLLCDGSVRFVNQNINNAIFCTLITPSDGKVTGEF